MKSSELFIATGHEIFKNLTAACERVVVIDRMGKRGRSSSSQDSSIMRHMGILLPFSLKLVIALNRANRIHLVQRSFHWNGRGRGNRTDADDRLGLNCRLAIDSQVIFRWNAFQTEIHANVTSRAN